MKTSTYYHNLRLMVFQRNIFLGLTILLSLSLAILSIFLFWKSERIVVVPPMIEKEFWVDSRGVSGSYLEQFGGFIGQLLLSKSAQTAQNQRAILLRHTDPSFSTLLSKKLGEEEQKLLKENASYVFYPIEARSNPKTNEVLLIGDRTIYVSGTSISSERVRYILSFSNQGPRLLLKGITLSEEEK